MLHTTPTAFRTNRGGTGSNGVTDEALLRELDLLVPEFLDARLHLACVIARRERATPRDENDDARWRRVARDFAVPATEARLLLELGESLAAEAEAARLSPQAGRKRGLGLRRTRRQRPAAPP